MQVGIALHADAGGHVVDIEQRQGAAGGLLGAAIGVAVEAHQQRRHIEGGSLRDTDADRRAVKNACGEQFLVDAQRAAIGSQVDHHTVGDRKLCRAHRQIERLLDLRPTVMRELDGDRSSACRARNQREGERLPLALGERQLLGQGLVAGREVSGRGDRQLVIAGGAVGVGDIEAHGRGIAGRQEARQAGRDHHRIAHDDIGLGMADGFLGPGDGHDAHGAVELRDVEVDPRLAVGIEFNRAGEEGDQLLGRRTALRLHVGAVATCPELAGGAERAVDQAAIKVADLETQHALTEEPILRIWRLVVGEIEDADIDGRDHHIGVAAGLRAVDGDRDRKLLARRRLFRRRQRDGELLRARIDGQPLDADGAGRHARLLSIARPEQRRRDVGAGAPVFADRDVDGASAGRHRSSDGLQKFLGANGDEQFAGKMRRDLQLGDFSGGVGVFVEGDLQSVGRFGGGRGDIPAGIELIAGRRTVRIGRLDLDPVAAPVNGKRHGCFAVGIQVDLAIGYGLGEVDRFIVPGIVGTVPLVVALDLHQ